MAQVSSIYPSKSRNTLFCAVHIDGNASCWGERADYQLGDGDGSQSGVVYVPTTVYNPGVGDIIQMAVSERYTCALIEGGEVYCWGYNNNGQLGDGTACFGGTFDNNCNGDGYKPIMYSPVVLPNGTSAISIYPHVYQEATCALLNNGRIFCWGGSESYFDSDSAEGGIGRYQPLLGHFVQPGNRDWDQDGVFNVWDNCANGVPGWVSTSSNDYDSDGCDDATEDTDDDADGFSDTAESDCGTDPLNGTDYPEDIDNDGLCAILDDDDDGDAVLDVDDDFPEDPYGFTQLSLGDGFQSGQPEDNASLGGSSYTSCAILTDETLRCWGMNRYGQIGDG